MPSYMLKLPAELIVQIAINTTADTVFALGQTSRLLRSICWDALVFFEVCQNRKWAKDVLQSHVTDVDLVARYAIAEARYERLDRLGPDGSGDRSQLLQYLPSITITGYPMPYFNFIDLFDNDLTACLSTGRTPEALHTALLKMGQSRDLLCFIFALGTMKQAPWLGYHSVQHYSRQHSCIMWHTYNELKHGVINETADHVDNFHSDCLFAVGELAAFLASAFPSDAEQGSGFDITAAAHPRPRNYIRVPNVSKIALLRSVRDIPIPMLPPDAALKAWNSWLRQQRASRSTSEYLDSGEWIGMYTYNRFAGTHLDPPMTGIRFQSQRIMNGQAVLSEGSGEDGIGEFDLRLSCGADGFIHGTKLYRDQRTRWSWHLSSTPFGLYGLWSDQTHVGQLGGLGGAVWLWKREWVL